jgi:outer membrane protein assembly factor BamB
MVAPETGLPDLLAARLEEHPAVRWQVRVGNSTLGTPTVAAGRAFVGTSGPKCGLVLCLDEATGKVLWELRSPLRDFTRCPLRPPQCEKKSPWDYVLMSGAIRTMGFCSSVTVDGDRGYVVTPRGEVLALDLKGLADGNEGPFTDEARYKADEGAPPAAPGPADADIVWLFDMWQEVKTRPADTFSCSILVHGDFLYLTTSNGVDLWPQYYPKPVAPPSPEAPSLIVLDKKTGRLVARDGERIGERLFHGQWSSPSKGEVGGRTLIFWGGGDGVCYAFEALAEAPEAPVTLKKAWSFDCNPPEFRVHSDGKLVDYRLGDVDLKGHKPPDPQAKAWFEKHVNKNDGTFLGLSEIIATPVFHEGRVYVAVGRDPRHGRGRGALWCINPSGTGNITETGRIWCYRDMDRTISTVAVADGLVYAADVAGRLHCVDAQTGGPLWVHETRGQTWASPLVAEGKVYHLTRSNLHILAAGREKKPLGRLTVGGGWSPVAANGALYLVVRNHLTAFGKGRSD